ncbi:MFS transporter [Ferruginivarius sediminum]|nr:MFS transporter [Ferruginivarius sediminum]
MIRTVGVLAACQALAMTCSALVIAVTALVGQTLAPDRGLATLPLALQFLGLMATTTPASYFMKRFGRRAGFTLGAAIGVVAGLLGMQAILVDSFNLYCLATVLTGAFLAHAMYYRFAAADNAADEHRSRAISLVMAGGVLAAIMGPQLANWSKDLFAPIDFAGGYLVVAVLCGVQVVLVQFARLPKPRPAERALGGRRLGALLRHPSLVLAIACGMVAYGAMNLIMSVTPPAMLDCGHSFGSAAFVIQWHVFAMYAPAFFTGHLIQRFGVRAIVATGALFMLACVAANLSGQEIVQFAGALVLLGVGWNFMFVGGTTWVTQLHAEGEKAKVQALNDVLVFATVAVTSLGSGWIFDRLGWAAVNVAIVVPVVLVLLAVVMLARSTDAEEERAAAE